MNSYDISSLLLNIHWLRTRQQWIENRATYMMSFKGKFERKILMGWKVSSAPIVAPTNRQVSLNMSFLKLQLVVNYCAIDVFYEACTISIESLHIHCGITSDWPFNVILIAGSWMNTRVNFLEKHVSLSKLQLIKIHLLWLRLALPFFTTVLCFFFSTVPCVFQFGAVFFHYASLLFF